jgi:drug/metabolite transporter (DMT)-like permease
MGAGDRPSPSIRARRVGLLLLAIGLAGVVLGLLFFPRSNLLGGLGPIFGVLVGIGAVVLVVGGVAALVTRRLARCGREAEADEAPHEP